MTSISSSSSFAPNNLMKWINDLEQALIEPTSLISSLPNSSDLSFERTLSRSLAKKLDSESDRLLSLASKVLTWSTSTASPKGQQVLDSDLIKDGAYGIVLDPIERLLEKVDDEIEQHLGLGKSKPGAKNQAVGSSSHALMGTKGSSSSTKEPPTVKDKLAPHLLHDPNVIKPQLSFAPRLLIPRPSIDEHSLETPLWKPILTEKLHSKFSADEKEWLKIMPYQAFDRFTNVTRTEPPNYPIYRHPYETELKFLKPPDTFGILPNEPTKAEKDSFEKTPFEWVDSTEKLKGLIQDIRRVGEKGMRELAIDLEHHETRCWSGITCLIQLSTREKDYVIDALDPNVRNELEALNEFLTDPEWIKVFHGANSDIIWLQRDFGLYVIGLFDTYHATKVLGHAQHSLASLLEMYTDFVPDKRYQLADWRIRPLPPAMLHYARSDTHYLLSIYDHLRLALHAKAEKKETDSTTSEEFHSPLVEVFNRSIKVSASVYSIPPYDFSTGHFESGWLQLLSRNNQLKAYATARAVPNLPIKSGWGPGELSFEIMRNVHRWRETVAREEDEGTSWILPNLAIFLLAEKKPVEPVEVLKVIGGNRGGVSEIVRRRKDELAKVIKDVVDSIAGESNERSGQVEVISEAMAHDQDRGLAVSEPAVVPVAASLWGEDAGSSKSLVIPIASSSSFFGKTSKSNKLTTTTSTTKVNGLVANTSGFFGSGSKGKGKAKAVVEEVAMSTSRMEAVARIHASLILGGGLGDSLQGSKVPEPVAAASIQPDDAAQFDVESSTTHDEALTGDHSFIPFGERSTQPIVPSTSKKAIERAPDNKDVIVVSSLADKPKKRKRHTSTTASTSESASVAADASTSTSVTTPKAKKVKVKRSDRGPVTPHDYSQASSILDADPNSVSVLTEGKKGKKGKKAETIGRAPKGFVVDTSDFRREPRVNNAPKKGNVSMSFAK